MEETHFAVVNLELNCWIGRVESVMLVVQLALKVIRQAHYDQEEVLEERCSYQ